MANNLAAFNSEAWSERLVTRLDQVNIMLPLINRNWEGDLRQNKTVWIRTPGQIAISSYTRGTVISYQDLTPSKEAFTVNDGEYFAFEVDDIDKAQSDINAMDVYMKRAVVAMNNTVESKILSPAYNSAGFYGASGLTSLVPDANLLTAANPGSGATVSLTVTGGVITGASVTAGGSGYTVSPLVQISVPAGQPGGGAKITTTVSGGAVTGVTVVYGGSGYTGTAPTATVGGGESLPLTLDSTTSLTTGIYALFCKARTIQSNNNVPATPGQRWAIIDPATTSLLLQDTDHFVRAGELGDQVVQYGLIGGEEVARTAAEAPGFIGMIAGYSVYETPHIPFDSNGNKRLLFGDNEAISYAAQITEIEALRLQTTFANAVRGLLLHDVFVPAESTKRLVSIVATP